MTKYGTQLKLHKPVLTDEVCDLLGLDSAHLKSKARLKVKPEGKTRTFVDATVGMGGHSVKIVESGNYLLGIDADDWSLEYAKKRLQEACPPLLDKDKSISQGCFKLVHGNFKDISSLVANTGVKEADGVLFDLGISTSQMLDTTRGFSFQNPEAPLDMRIDKKDQAVTAANLLNVLRKDQLVDLFSKVMPKGASVKLARDIINFRESKSISTVGDFLEVTNNVKLGKHSHLHPATLAFMAVRIAVNSELENIKLALPQAFSILNRGGRLVVITFHSGEDRLVKEYFKILEVDGLAKKLTPKPILPSKQEVDTNASARSAKLRAIEKL